MNGMNIMKNISKKNTRISSYVTSPTIKYSPSIHHFDVTLRDGLQSLNRCYTFHEKRTILNEIVKEKSPKSIEVGSIVSPKILPQMIDSIQLYNYATKNFTTPTFYMLVPNKRSMKVAIANNIRNISLITSVSDKFQLKNTNVSLEENKKQISYMVSQNHFDKVKLYISCINECPIDGIICPNKIIEDIIFYSQFDNINELCISDTCGTLQFNTFKYIIDNIIQCVDYNRISIHLHESGSNKYNIHNIINYAYAECGIYRYDVSYFKDMGGCSVTINKHNLNSNLTYETLTQSIIL